MQSEGDMKIEQTEIDRMICSLVQQIKKSGKHYSKIVGVRKGGIYISTKLAADLYLPHESIKISVYGSGRVANTLIEGYEGFAYDPDLLLVDDLIDNGHTISRFFAKFGKVDTAVLYWRTDNPVGLVPTYYAAHKPLEWLEFPWETS